MRFHRSIKEAAVRSQISSATLGAGVLRVEGPLVLAADEGGVIPLIAHVVMVQGTKFAHGHDKSPRAGAQASWVVPADMSETFTVGTPALASGVIVFVDPGDAGETPIPQTFAWTELVD